MFKRSISLEEQKSIHLEMLKEIDSFCRNNGIRYSLACGTLLGAIRHKGFIPWDDDTDITMPLPDMLRFKKEFVSNRIRYIDVDTCRHYSYAFSKLVFLPTYSQGKSLEKQYGINIDLYPVLGLPKDKCQIDAFLREAEPILQKRLKIMKWNHLINHIIPYVKLPNYDTFMREYRDKMFSNQYDGSVFYFHMTGNLAHFHVFDSELFDKLTDFEFEDIKLLGFQEYDKYLSQLYGDYMKLPPETDRHPYHGGQYFWK